MTTELAPQLPLAPTPQPERPSDPTPLPGSSAVPVTGPPRPDRPLLAQIAGPADLKALDPRRLLELATEIRGFLIDKVCATGGHLGVNLGVVELTLAVHRVFDSPRDVVLFDTGHQAYVHKILTGRQLGFDGLRRGGGMSGYPSRAESAHDWVENSHASTALSYADGIAKALHLSGQLGSQDGGRAVVAVIGDGALTGGLAWEGLNNLSADPDRPLIVVLNDNGRSYAPTIGGLAHHLAKVRDRHRRPPLRRREQPPPSWPYAEKTIFEQLGLAYVGPIDGHDITVLEQALQHARSLHRTVVVHAITRKGNGYGPAEADQADQMHGIGVLDPATGTPATAGKASWTSVFGQEITAIGEQRPDVVAVTAAMLQPVGLKTFADRFPDRVFDVGIAEQHAVCSAAGLAIGGLHPVVCVYATFLNRAFDQVLMDVALHALPVTFVLDRAGITGPDGASHHGMWDTSILGVIPGVRVAAPRDPARLRELLREAVDHHDGPTVVRFPKASAGPDIPAISRMDGLDILHRSTSAPLDVLLVAAGVMASPCLSAATLLERSGLGVTVIDPGWIIPVSPALVHLASRHRLVVSVEDAGRTGGMGAAITQACADNAVPTPIRVLGLPQEYIEHGERSDLLRQCGLTAQQIAATALASDGRGVTR